MLSGNKGEWSEIYVFLKLLADGKLHAADANLDSIPNVYYPIIKILREEGVAKKEYILNGNIKIIDGNTNAVLYNISISKFIQKSQKLFNDLKSAKGSSFSFPLIEQFLSSIDVHSLTAPKTNKSDILLVVHDLNTGLKPKLGFSIKSLLGKKSTLFNPGIGTNFIYRLSKPKGIKFDLKKFNTDTFNQANVPRKSKITIRLNKLEQLGFKIAFENIQSENFQLNLKLIDSKLPELLSNVVLIKYKNSKSKIVDILSEINNINPLNYNLSKGHPFYEYKIRNFLVDSALGMTTETVWTGEYDATGGIIIVKKDGNLVCYHIYNKNEFQEYLINNTKLEQASTSENKIYPGTASTDKKAKPYKFGWVYEEHNHYFIKLNLQIRFS